MPTIRARRMKSASTALTSLRYWNGDTALPLNRAVSLAIVGVNPRSRSRNHACSMIQKPTRP